MLNVSDFSPLPISLELVLAGKRELFDIELLIRVAWHSPVLCKFERTIVEAWELFDQWVPPYFPASTVDFKGRGEILIRD